MEYQEPELKMIVFEEGDVFTLEVGGEGSSEQIQFSSFFSTRSLGDWD